MHTRILVTISLLIATVAIAQEPVELQAARKSYVAQLESLKKTMVFKKNDEGVSAVQAELDKVTPVQAGQVDGKQVKEVDLSRLISGVWDFRPPGGWDQVTFAKVDDLLICYGNDGVTVLPSTLQDNTLTILGFAFDISKGIKDTMAGVNARGQQYTLKRLSTAKKPKK